MDDRQVMGLGFLPPIGSPEILRIVKKVRANHLRSACRDNPSEGAFDNACSGAGLHGCQLDAAMAHAKKKSRLANC